MTATKQKARSEETKRKIVEAAGRLFASKGYQAVTMREIAKAAHCSHTAIYIYFKDKEALLTQLSMPPLLTLLQTFDALLNEDRPPEQRLAAISLEFIGFCLAHRSLYGLFFGTKSVRVDEEAPDLELNQLRNSMFGKLKGAVRACLGMRADDPQALEFARIYMYGLNGIAATYAESEESAEQLMDRLTPTFRQAFDVLLAGFRHQLANRAGG
ncbi:TetR/AcrR family transcriptional regulator [Cohnella hongkongensis]|uniref:TetR/AcrR family transcriptional regulator n=1 Tax=Cohnella hongkongensis TaxID=178337 RepID=A0ABV9FDR1_9BACL